MHKVNDVSSSALKSAKPADLQANLKDINIKMSFEDKKTKRVDNENVVQ